MAPGVALSRCCLTGHLSGLASASVPEGCSGHGHNTFPIDPNSSQTTGCTPSAAEPGCPVLCTGTSLGAEEPARKREGADVRGGRRDGIKAARETQEGGAGTMGFSLAVPGEPGRAGSGRFREVGFTTLKTLRTQLRGRWSCAAPRRASSAWPARGTLPASGPRYGSSPPPTRLCAEAARKEGGSLGPPSRAAGKEGRTWNWRLVGGGFWVGCSHPPLAGVGLSNQRLGRQRAC